MKREQVGQVVHQLKSTLRRHGWLIAAFVAVVLALTGATLVRAAAPPAGTQIGNQASASYTDQAGVQRTATSNVALTTVQQVGAITMSQDQTKLVSPGGQVVFPHTLTNTGNGTDAFSLVVNQLSSDNFDLTSVHIYADANGDGVPDNFTDIATTGPLPAGSVFQFVVVGTVPSSATATQHGDLQVITKSGFDASKTATNTDVSRISNQAVVTVTKSELLNAGNPGVTNTYTLTYVNNGNNTATNLVLTDTIPAGLTYLLGSARWSVSGATALTDATGPGDPAGIDYSFDNVGKTVSATITNVNPGITGYLTFQVLVNSNNLPGVINNTASFNYGDGSGTTITNQQSNTTGFNVSQLAAVRADDNPQQAGDPALDKIVEVLAAAQGAVVTFSNQVHNLGNGSDSFSAAIVSNNFPSGTSFQFFQNDAATPLVGAVTGPLAASNAYTVVVKATLPPGSTGGPFTATLSATSVFNPSVSDTVVDKLDAISASSVDLTANSALPGAPGAGHGPEASPVVTNTAAPGATTRFTLYVNNTTTNGNPDTFNLSLTNSLPAGWQVVFKNSGGAVIPTVGPLAASSNQLVYADVTVPANSAPGNIDLFWQVLSPTTSASDILHGRVVVSVVHNIAVTPNGAGQITPGGSLVYPHQLCNLGNTNETVTLVIANSAGGWNSTLYTDSNGNGTFDTNDVPVNGTLTLAPGACTSLWVKVVAPAGATVNSQNQTTINAATGGATATATADDVTTVIASNLMLLKEQAIDATCGGGTVTFSDQPLTTGAIPGACVRYRITVTNNGISTNTNVHVTDSTPPFTSYNNIISITVSGGTVNTVTPATPANGYAGPFDFNIGTLAPGASATCTFQIKINQ